MGKRRKATPTAPQPSAADLQIGAELERRLRESPDDAGARGVLADWLEQHGQLAMATFVRAGGAIYTADDAERQLDAVLTALRERNQQPGRTYGARGIDLAAHTETRLIVESPQIALWLRATIGRIERVQQLYNARDRGVPAFLAGGVRPFMEAHEYLKLIASQLMRRKPELDDADVVYVLDVMSRGESVPGLRHLLPWAGLVGAVERHVKARGLSPAVRAAIERVRSELLRKPGVILTKDDIQIRTRLEAVLEA